jgi:L-rhamnonate dehydratase
VRGCARGKRRGLANIDGLHRIGPRPSPRTKVRITDVESTVLRLPDVKRIGDGAQSILLIRIRTDAGITGIGEAHSNPTVSKAIIEAPLCSVSSCGLRELLIGENPLDIARLTDKMQLAAQTYGRGGAFMHALSGIDIALWDILGKATGQPIFRLLGGARRISCRSTPAI